MPALALARILARGQARAQDAAEREESRRRARACPWCRPSPLFNSADGQAGYALACLYLRWTECGIKPWDLHGQREAGGMPVPLPIPRVRVSGPSVATTSPPPARPSPPPPPPSAGAAKPKPYDPSPDNTARMEKGRPPQGVDGHPVEIHHDGQKPDGDRVMMTRTEHRLGENFKKNHPNTGQKRSDVQHEYPWEKEVKETWKREAGLPENQAQKPKK